MPDRNGLVPPQLPDAPRVKKVYPPLQWWPLRVMNPWHKLAILVAFVLGARAVTWLAGLVIPSAVVEDGWAILSTVIIVAIARSFRGWEEPVAPPRAWWRLTARPRSGWWLAVVYLLAAAAPVNRGWHPGMLVDGVTSLLLGIAFLNSSIRLTIGRRRARAAQ